MRTTNLRVARPGHRSAPPGSPCAAAAQPRSSLQSRSAFMADVSPPISRFPVPELAGLPDDLRSKMLEVQAKAGFVPNVFLALAHRPDELRAFMAYHDALL